MSDVFRGAPKAAGQPTSSRSHFLCKHSALFISFVFFPPGCQTIVLILCLGVTFWCLEQPTMIHSLWSLCQACPSMAADKVNSLLWPIYLATFGLFPEPVACIDGPFCLWQLIEFSAADRLHQCPLRVVHESASPRLAPIRSDKISSANEPGARASFPPKRFPSRRHCQKLLLSIGWPSLFLASGTSLPSVRMAKS